MHVTIRKFVKDFQQVVLQQIASNSMTIGKGTCATMEEYKRKVGFNDGLSAASELADKMLRQIEEADHNDDLPQMPGGSS